MATALETFITAMTDIQRHGPVYNQIKKLSDGVYNTTMLLNELNRHKTPWTGGGGAMIGNIEKTVQKAQHYIGAQKLNQTPQAPLDTWIALRWWLDAEVTYNKTDLDQNKGDKMVPYVGQRIDMARKGMAETLELNLLGNGTTSADGRILTGAPHIMGFQYMLSTTATTGTVFNIGKTNTYWQHNVKDMATVAGVTTAKMKSLWMMCNHTDGPPTFAMTNDNFFQEIHKLAKTEKWPMRDWVLKKAYDLGYPQAIDFDGCPIVPSKHMTGTTTSGVLSTGDLKRMYVLNSKTFRWEIDPADDMVLEEAIKVADQRTLVQHLGINGSFVITNPRSNGVAYYA